MSIDPIRLVDGRAVLHIIGNAFDDSADFTSADYVRIRRQIEALPTAGRWVPCSERLPEEPFRCIVTAWDTNPFTMDDFENVLPYFVGWDGEQWNDEDGERCPFEVIAWKAVGEPYRLEGGQNE